MNVISFSLWGKHPKYWGGLVKNIALRDKFFPGWHIMVYCDQENFERFTGCSNQTSGEYTSTNTNITYSFGFENWCPPMMQRYLAADWGLVRRVLFRDADSRLSQREADAVQAWIESDKICLILRDHPAHVLIPGGMLGLQPRRDNWEMPPMRGLIYRYLEHCAMVDLDPTEYGADQDFLSINCWNMFRDSTLQFDAIAGRRRELGALPWPTPRTDWPRFVGEVMECDEHGNETPRPGDWESCPKE